MLEKGSAAQGPAAEVLLVWCCCSRPCLLSFEVSHQPTPARPLRLGQLDNVPLDASSSFGEILANKIVVKVREKRALGLKSQIESCLQFIESDVENRFVDSCNYRLFPLSQDRDDGFDIGTSWLSAGQRANRDSYVIDKPKASAFAASIAERLGGNRPSGPAAP